MRRLLFRIWSWPWPNAWRRRVEPLATLGVVQRLLVPHFRVGVVGVIQNDAGEYLLLRHTYRNEFPWGLPTGFLEPGEQPINALRRELREEAGMEIRPGRVWQVYADYRGIISIVFRGRACPGVFVPSAEISELAFCQAADLPPLLPEQRELLNRSEKEASH